MHLERPAAPPAPAAGAPLCCGELLARVATDGHAALRLLTIDCGGDAPLKIAPNAPNVNVPRIAFFFDAHKSDSSYLQFFP